MISALLRPIGVKSYGKSGKIAIFLAKTRPVTVLISSFHVKFHPQVTVSISFCTEKLWIRLFRVTVLKCHCKTLQFLEIYGITCTLKKTGVTVLMSIGHSFENSTIYTNNY